jgi:hypothetical protein
MPSHLFMLIILSSQPSLNPYLLKLMQKNACVYNVQLSLFMRQTFINGVMLIRRRANLNLFCITCLILYSTAYN